MRRSRPGALLGAPVVAEHGTDVTAVDDQRVHHQPREDAVHAPGRRQADVGEEP
jgi:hypothetical protein